MHECRRRTRCCDTIAGDPISYDDVRDLSADAGTLRAIAAVDDGTFTWDAPVPARRRPCPVQVLLGGASASTPHGLLVTVTSVTSNSGDEDVSTSPASLSDAFSSLGFSYGGDPLAAPGAEFRRRSLALEPSDLVLSVSLHSLRRSVSISAMDPSK